MGLVRLYSDADGESHFGPFEIALSEVELTPPAPAFLVSEPVDVSRCLICRIPARWSSDWHRAPRRQLFFVLAGEIEVGVSDGEVRRLRAGDMGLVEDVAGRGHTTRVVGDEDVSIVFAQLPA